MKQVITDSWNDYQKECSDALVKYNKAHNEYLKTCETAGIKHQKICADFFVQPAAAKPK